MGLPSDRRRFRVSAGGFDWAAEEALDEIVAGLCELSEAWDGVDLHEGAWDEVRDAPFSPCESCPCCERRRT